MSVMRCMDNGLRPVNRSALRLRLGKLYYSSRKQLWLWRNRQAFGAVDQGAGGRFIFPAVEHRTPLLRSLKNVDLYLQYNKVINLKLAVRSMDGLVLQPGQMFSYWNCIGKPSYARGFVDGMVLSGGSFGAGPGGGLCQLSNLIYWMAVHTPLTVMERWRHSYDVFPDAGRTQPFGSGATCVYNYRDLVLKNNTQTACQLRVCVTETDLAGGIWMAQPPSFRYEVYEAEHRIENEFWGGYSRHNVIRRRKYDGEGCLVDDEYVTENHALMMYAPFLEGGAGGIQ